MSFSFHVPTNFVFGQGAVQKLHKQRLPGKKALIVISSGKSTRANGYLDTVQDQLTQAGVEYAVFDKMSQLGWYPTKNAPQTEIDEAKQKFSQLQQQLG